jgi:hypothetical protein
MDLGYTSAGFALIAAVAAIATVPAIRRMSPRWDRPGTTPEQIAAYETRMIQGWTVVVAVFGLIAAVLAFIEAGR